MHAAPADTLDHFPRQPLLASAGMPVDQTASQLAYADLPCANALPVTACLPIADCDGSDSVKSDTGSSTAACLGSDHSEQSVLELDDQLCGACTDKDPFGSAQSGLAGVTRDDGGVEVTLEDFMDSVFNVNEMQPNDLDPVTQPLWQNAPPPLASAPMLPIPYSHEALSIAPQPFWSHAVPTSAVGGGDPSYAATHTMGQGVIKQGLDPVAIGGYPPPGACGSVSCLHSTHLPSPQAAPPPVHGHNGVPFAGWSTIGSHGSAGEAAAMGVPPVGAVTLFPQWIPVASSQLPLRFCVDQIASMTGAHPGTLAAATATEPAAGREDAPSLDSATALQSAPLESAPPRSSLEGALAQGTLAAGKEMTIDVAIFGELFDAGNDAEDSPHASEAAEVATALPRPCASCRARRVLCDRTYPCSQCARRGEVCIVPPTVRRGRPIKSGRWCKKRPLAEVETKDCLAPPLPPMSPPSSDATAKAPTRGHARARSSTRDRV